MTDFDEVSARDLPDWRVGVTLGMAPVSCAFIGVWRPPHMDGPSKTGTHHARSRFEVERFSPLQL
eukprot:scaffold258419_cov36-Tisochrysis_lutea.AAC.1